MLYLFKLELKKFHLPDKSFPKDGYQGEYINDIADAFLSKKEFNFKEMQIKPSGNIEDFSDITEFSVAYLRNEQDLDLESFNVTFDVFSLESSFYQSGKVEEIIKLLNKNGHTYEKDNALWLKTTLYGDDKDRVMRKTDGEYTYFVPDIAYHLDKWERGFKRVINEQGADHHSTINRVRGGLQALEKNIPPEMARIYSSSNDNSYEK